MNNHEYERRQHLLAAMRSARLQMRWVSDEIDCCGIMLAHGGITIRDAMEWLDDLGASHLLADVVYRNLLVDQVDELERVDGVVDEQVAEIAKNKDHHVD